MDKAHSVLEVWRSLMTTNAAPNETKKQTKKTPSAGKHSSGILEEQSLTFNPYIYLKMLLCVNGSRVPPAIPVLS